MINFYEQIINKYREKTTELEIDFQEFWNIRNFYKIRRPDHICITMIGASILPMTIALLVTLLLIAQNKIEPNIARMLIIASISFGCFVITPIINLKQRNKLKRYNYLIKKKSSTQIIIDDFKNYFSRVQYSFQAQINSKIIRHFEKEISNEKDKKELLAKLEKEYTITPKDNNSKTADKIQLDYLKELEEEYYLQLSMQTKKLAITNFFPKSFKQDWMTTSMHGMMSGMILMLYWNIPLFITNQKEPHPSNNLVLDLILAMIIPMIIGCAGPFIWNYYNKRRNKLALDAICKESSLIPDFKKYQHDVKKEVEENIEELEEKIVLTKIKIEKLENESV